MEVPAYSGWNRVAMEDPSGVHGGCFYSEGVLMCIKKQGDSFGIEEDVV
jgi:hypothetical protein